MVNSKVFLIILLFLKNQHCHFVIYVKYKQLSRDQWKSPVQPYQPVFMDGWSPNFPVIDENPQPRFEQISLISRKFCFYQCFVLFCLKLLYRV